MASDESEGGSIPLVSHRLPPLGHESKNAGQNEKPYEQTDHFILHVVEVAERGHSALLTCPSVAPGTSPLSENGVPEAIRTADPRISSTLTAADFFGFSATMGSVVSA